MKTIKEIIVFQAPYASLVDCGLLLQIHQPEGVQGVVPSQYYLPVFHGRVALEAPASDPDTLLEAIFAMFNQNNRPNPMTMRSLSVGDVVYMDGVYYLTVSRGFSKVKFEAPVEGDPNIPKPEKREDFGRYLTEKYNINGKAATLLNNILEYNNYQGWDSEEESCFLESMFSGLGISSEDRGLFCEEDE